MHLKLLAAGGGAVGWGQVRGLEGAAPEIPDRGARGGVCKVRALPVPELVVVHAREGLGQLLPLDQPAACQLQLNPATPS